MNGKKPNIILILADDMGFSDIGCFGSEIDTPNIDSLARDGMRFTQMYNNARCCPSRASLLTGLTPHKAGVGHMTKMLGKEGYLGHLNDKCATIAEVLKSGGYSTGLSGKWHVGGNYYVNGVIENPDQPHPTPTKRGFDEFFGILEGATSYYNPHTLFRNETPIKAEDYDDFYFTEKIAENAVGMIDDFTARKNPFFLYVSFTAPHWPLQAREEVIEKYIGKYKGGWDELRLSRYKKLIELGIIKDNWQLSLRDEASYPWEETEHPDWEDRRMAVYAAQIDAMDKCIGTILEKLTELKIDDNTLVMFMSDNGGCSEFLCEDGWVNTYSPPTRDGKKVQTGNDPGRMPGGDDTYMSYDLPWANASNTPFRYFKHWVHEGGIATPFLCRWPEKIKGGENSDAPIHFIDIAAMCYDISGIKYPEVFKGNNLHTLDGESFAPAFENSSWTRERPIIWEHEGNCAVRDGKYKLVKKFKCDWELYDMETDRTEIHDLSGKYPEIVKKMSDIYNAWTEKALVVPFEDFGINEIF